MDFDMKPQVFMSGEPCVPSPGGKGNDWCVCFVLFCFFDINQFLKVLWKASFYVITRNTSIVQFELGLYSILEQVIGPALLAEIGYPLDLTERPDGTNQTISTIINCFVFSLYNIYHATF